MSISGMFGSFRWYKVGDADIEETVLVCFELKYFISYISVLSDLVPYYF